MWGEYTVQSEMAVVDSVANSSYTFGRATTLAQIARPFLNVHHQGDLSNVFVCSLPRSGSTWLMELIWSQPGFKCCNEPTDLRNPYVRKHLGISDWQSLYDEAADECLRNYFEGFCQGRIGFLNQRPFSRYYRPYTKRLVFKVIHGCEERLNWFQDTFNGRIVYLVRHPIAVSLSRETLPTLPALINGSYRHHFTADQLRDADDIYHNGTRLERGVLSWCLQTAVPLRAATDDWVIASYEQMILEPEPIIHQLATKLDLPKPQRMLDRIATPSHSSRKSDGSTRQLLDGEQPTRARRLIEKWRDQVSADEERRAMEILQRFDIDIYRFGDPLPTERIWLPGARASDLVPALS
jgi:hypothetical protein